MRLPGSRSRALRTIQEGPDSGEYFYLRFRSPNSLTLQWHANTVPPIRDGNCERRVAPIPPAENGDCTQETWIG